MITLVLPFEDIVVDPRRYIDLTTLPVPEAIALLKTAFAFLGDSVEVSIHEQVATIIAQAASPQAQREAQRTFERALKLAQQGSYDRAIQLFEQSLQSVPESVDARRNLAMAYLESGQSDRAETTVLEALRLNPKDAWSNLLLGNILAKQAKNVEAALKWYRRAYEVNPHDAILLTNLGAIMTEQGERDKAVEYFKQAIAADPKYPNAYYALALFYFRNDQPELTLSQLDDLFTQTQSADVRSKLLMDEARKLYLQASEATATAKHADLLHFVADRQLRFNSEVQQVDGRILQKVS